MSTVMIPQLTLGWRLKMALGDMAVWAETAEQAEATVRSAVRHKAGSESWRKVDELWIEKPEWRLHVRPAPTEGVALVHWHAG
jgi:hypothetical protein